MTITPEDKSKLTWQQRVVNNLNFVSTKFKNIPDIILKYYVIKDLTTGRLTGVIPLIYNENTMPLFFNSVNRDVSEFVIIPVIFSDHKPNEGSFGVVVQNKENKHFLCGNPKRGKSFISVVKAPRLYMTSKKALAAARSKFKGPWVALHVVPVSSVQKAPGL